MANIIPFSFRGELFSGTHNFANGGDSFKIALYTSNPYSTSSTAYLTTNEVSASNTGYTTAGQVLGSQAVASGTAVASVDFADSVINDSPILSGTSIDALETMKLVFKIYYNDEDWRKKYNIPNPLI